MSESASALALEQDHQHFVESIKQGANNIMVAVRLRPLNQKEVQKSEFETVKTLDERVLTLLDPGYELNPDDVLRKNRNKEMQFAFDLVFDKNCEQEDIYKKTTSILIPGVFEGFNATVFAYGATGAGKTYTMIGVGENIGIMERSMNDLFFQMVEQSVTKEIFIRTSYIEIYNETIKDLLSSTDKNLELREDPTQGVVVNGLTEIEVKTTYEILQLLKIGNKNRTVESTGANEVSSRSHAVLQIGLQVKEKAGGISQEIQYSKLSLVDLAGSERASNTQNRGIRLIEGAKINQSLLILGNCIQALSEATEKNLKNPFIQYRGSKLTRLLKDSLGGNCRTVMIANVSCHVGSFEDTYNTLNFANRAKSIKTSVQRNSLSVENHISNYAVLIDSLRKENDNLKRLLQNKSPTADFREMNNSSSCCNLIDEKINDHFKEEIELAQKLDDINTKIDSFQSYQKNIINVNSSYQEDSSEQSISIDDNQKLLKLQKTKQEIEKKLQEMVSIRCKLQKMIQTEGLNVSEQNYLYSKISQNELTAEKLSKGNKPKKLSIITSEKERQIQLLKDQVKLRDDIINEQRSILQKNQLGNQIVRNSSHSSIPLIEFQQILQQISPNAQQISPIQFRNRSNKSNHMKYTNNKSNNNNSSPDNNNKYLIKLPNLNSTPAKNTLRIASKPRNINRDLSDTSMINASDSNGNDKISINKNNKQILENDKFSFITEGDLKTQVTSIQSKVSPYTLKHDISNVKHQSQQKQDPIQNQPFPSLQKQSQQEEKLDGYKESNGTIVNSSNSNTWKRNYLQGSQTKRKMPNYYENFKKPQSISVHNTQSSQPSPTNKTNLSILDKSAEDLFSKDKLTSYKSGQAFLDNFQIPSRQIQTPSVGSRMSKHSLCTLAKQPLEQMPLRDKSNIRGGGMESVSSSQEYKIKSQADFQTDSNDNSDASEQFQPLRERKVNCSQDGNLYCRMNDKPTFRARSKNLHLDNFEDEPEESGQEERLRSNLSTTPKIKKILAMMKERNIQVVSRTEESKDIVSRNDSVSISVGGKINDELSRKALRLKQLNLDIKKLKRVEMHSMSNNNQKMEQLSKQSQQQKSSKQKNYKLSNNHINNNINTNNSLLTQFYDNNNINTKEKMAPKYNGNW